MFWDRVFYELDPLRKQTIKEDWKGWELGKYIPSIFESILNLGTKISQMVKPILKVKKFISYHKFNDKGVVFFSSYPHDTS